MEGEVRNNLDVAFKLAVALRLIEDLNARGLDPATVVDVLHWSTLLAYTGVMNQ